MQDFLMNCYYEGMKSEDAVKLYESFYKKSIPAKSVQIAKNQIKITTGKEWE